jgi:hypothetical protein
MQSIEPMNNNNVTQNGGAAILKSRWFYLGITVLITSIVLVFTLDMQMYALSLTSGLLGIALAAYFILRITLRPITTPEMVEVAGDIRSGARTYLRRQIKRSCLLPPSSHCCCIGSLTGRQPSQRSSAC